MTRDPSVQREATIRALLYPVQFEHQLGWEALERVSELVRGGLVCELRPGEAAAAIREALAGAAPLAPLVEALASEGQVREFLAALASVLESP